MNKTKQQVKDFVMIMLGAPVQPIHPVVHKLIDRAVNLAFKQAEKDKQGFALRYVQARVTNAGIMLKHGH